jgi:hypothetical protein
MCDGDSVHGAPSTFRRGTLRLNPTACNAQLSVFALQARPLSALDYREPAFELAVMAGGLDRIRWVKVRRVFGCRPGREAAVKSRVDQLADAPHDRSRQAASRE